MSHANNEPAGQNSAWHSRRLQLRALPAGIRLLAGLTVSVAVVACLFILFIALGWSLPGGSILVPAPLLPYTPSDPQAIPNLIIIFFYLSCAVAAAALTVGALHHGWQFPRLTIALIAFLSASWAADLVRVSELLAALEANQQPMPELIASRIVAGAAWLGIGLAGALAIVAIRLPRQSVRTAAWLSAGPFLLILGAYLLTGSTTLAVDETLVTIDGLAGQVSPRLLILHSTLSSSNYLTLATIAFVFWQAVVGARAIRRELGVRIADQTARWSWLLALLLLTKLIWLVGGYLGSLQDASDSVWARSLADGALSWVWAIVLASLIGWWLARGRMPIEERGFTRAIWFLIVGFLSLWIIAAIAALATQLFGLWPRSTALPPLNEPLVACFTEWLPRGLAAFSYCVADTTSTLAAYAGPVTIFVAAVIGIMLLWRRDHRAMAFLFLAVGLWPFFRAVNFAREYLDPSYVVPAVSPGNVDILTLDTAITLMVLVLAIMWWRKSQRGADPWSLTAVLVVSTLVAHDSTLIPAAWSIPIFYLALIFPVAYEYLFDSDALNSHSPTRPLRVLRTTGLTAVLMALVVMNVATGQISPFRSSWEAVIDLLFVPPFVALFVAAAISRHWRDAQLEDLPEVQPTQRAVQPPSPTHS